MGVEITVTVAICYATAMGTMEALKHLIHVGTTYSLGVYNLPGDTAQHVNWNLSSATTTTSQGDDPHSFLFTQEPTQYKQTC